MRLPLELLVGVFELLPLRDALSACAVCEYWNRVLAHGAPLVWVKLSSKALREGSLTTLLRRSGSAPFQLDLDIRRRNWKEASSCLKDNLSRCASLTVHFSQKLRDKAKQELTAALAQPAPLLRSLQLIDAQDQYHADSLAPSPLFACVAPALREVRLNLDFGALSHLVLPAVRKIVATNTSVSRATDVEVLTRAFPNAQELTFNIYAWDWEHNPGHRIAIPPSLQSLSVISRTSQIDPTQLLRRIDHQEIPHLLVQYSVWAHVDAARAGALLGELATFSLVTTVHLNTAGCDEVDGRRPGCIDMWAGVERARPQRTVLWYPCDAPIDAGLFTNLTRLLLGEIFLTDTGAPLPPAPALLELTIRAMAPVFQASDGHKSVFLLPRDRQLVLTCPALRKLTFGARSHAHAMYFAPHLALDFIHFHLDAPPLETLEIKGMELLTNVLDDMVALISLAQDFIVTDQYLVEYD